MIKRTAGTPAASQQGKQVHPATATITRAQFDALPQDSRAKFIREGGKVGDAGASSGSAPVPQAGAAGTMTRAQFDVTPPPQVAAFLKSGGKVVD